MGNILLIAGGGTLGTYTAKELLNLGHSVDVVCLEEKTSENTNLVFYKANATKEFLEELFAKKHYDGIVNFIHYPNVEDYKKIHGFLSANTDHLIFLSSYRVYADVEHPIKETSPLLLDVSTDKEFLRQETYALSKAKAEKFIIEDSGTDNWTIVRPVISFSQYRLDIVTISGQTVIERQKERKPIFLPIQAKNLTAGLDWAGNSGKLIANLLLKKEALKQIYTISSAQNLTWGEVADIYTDVLETEFEWIDTNEWLSHAEYIQNSYWAAVYDRLFDRTIDNSKVLKTTKLTKTDFKSIREGIQTELNLINTTN